MIKIAICDDEREAREQMERYCQKFFGEKYQYEIRTYESGEQFLNAEEKGDILLLDIEMDGIDGIEIKRRLQKERCNARILFVTSHSEHMPEAFGEYVYGFLQKPLEYAAFEEKMQEIMVELKEQNYQVLVRGVREERLVRVYDIFCITSQGKYAKLHLGQDEFYDVRTVREWQEELEDKDFAPARKGVLVNLARIKNLDREKRIVYMENGEVLNISRRQEKGFFSKCHKYMNKGAKRKVDSVKYM